MLEDRVKLERPAGEFVEEADDQGQPRLMFVGKDNNNFKVAAGLADSLIDIEKLNQHPRNYNSGDVESIQQSLKNHGMFRSIVVNLGSYTRRYDAWTVGAGNHTTVAALAEGWTHVAVGLVDVSDRELDNILMDDNHTAEKAWRDDGLLAVLMRERQEDGTGMEGSSWTDAEAQELIDRQERQEEDEEADEGSEEVPDKLGEVVTEPGDIWRLGDHHLIMCGDSGNRQDVDALFAVAGAEASLLWTDPPWGVSYVGKTKAALTIKNDTKDDTAALCADAFLAAQEHLIDACPFYVVHPAGTQAPIMWRVAEEMGWTVHQNLVWVKNQMVMGHSDHHFIHESIMYGYLPGTGRRGRGHKNWYGPDNAVSVFEVDRPKASREHPTVKPLNLCLPHIRNSTRKGEWVYDPFGGSGSTLIACELSGRRAVVLECDPGYCDVILRRFQKETGIKPVHALTNEEHDFPMPLED